MAGDAACRRTYACDIWKKFGSELMWQKKLHHNLSYEDLTDFAEIHGIFLHLKYTKYTCNCVIQIDVGLIRPHFFLMIWSSYGTKNCHSCSPLSFCGKCCCSCASLRSRFKGQNFRKFFYVVSFHLE